MKNAKVTAIDKCVDKIPSVQFSVFALKNHVGKCNRKCLV